MKKRKPTYLLFNLDKETYAVSTKKVLEVLEFQPITPMPNASQFIEGVISFRGNIIPVINIASKLKIKGGSKIDNYIIIIFDVKLNNKKAIIGAIVNSVSDVVSAADNEIGAIPEAGIVFDSELLMGMLHSNDKFTLIFDIDKVFAEENETIP